MKLEGLYLVTPDPRPKMFWEITEDALNAGLDLLQLRDKHSTPDSLVETATRLRNLCRKYDVPLIINDFPELYEKVHADGFHLGMSDYSVLDCRKKYPDALIGASAECDLVYAKRIQEYADYVGLGPFFPTRSKEDVVVCDISTMRGLKSSIKVPAFAIGGIDTENVRTVMSYGFSGVAVISSVYDSPNPSGTIRTFRSILDNFIDS